MGAWTSFYIGDFSHFVLAVVFTFSTGGAVAAGAVTVLNVLPGGLLGPLAATLATSRRPQLHLAIGIGARLVMMVMTIVAVLGGASVAVVLVLVGVDSLMSAAVRPLHGALCVRLAETVAEAAAANAVTSSLLSASALAGPALAGVALTIVDIGWAFMLPAAAFAAGAAAALMIRMPPSAAQAQRASAAPSGGALRAQFLAVGAGFRGILASRPAVAATALFMLNVTLTGVWYVASAPIAQERLGLGERGVTTIMTLYGAGGVIGALAVLATVGRRHLARVLFDSMLALAVVLAVIGLIVVPLPGLAIALGVGGAGAVAYALAPTLVQRNVSRDAMVPAAASLQSLYLVGVAAGGALAPVVIETVGVTRALAILGACSAVVTILTWPALRRADELTAQDAANLAVLRANPMLSPLPGLALERLARAATRLSIRTGSEVIHEGDRGDRFYMITAGLADVTVDGRRVATLGPGGSFGEIALLQDVPRSATVSAREDLDLVAVDRAEFLSALAGNGGGVARLGGVAQARLATRPVEERLVEIDRDAVLGPGSLAELLASQPPLASIGSDAVRELAHSARVVAAPDGALITREGDYGDVYYVILDGGADVLEGETPVRTLEPGDGFGELAILRDVPRTATVRAAGDTTLVALDRGAFERARRAGPAMPAET